MSIPGFSAEISVGKTGGGYSRDLEFGANRGSVLPQMFCLPDESGTTCYQCWDEGGFSGCISFRRPHFVQF